jgi:hypothetical protein
MKLLELFDKTFLNVKEEPYYGDGGDFLYECGIECSFEADSINLDDHGFTCRPINTWMCTDTLVGYYVIYFKGEFICSSYKPARKEDTEFEWVSQEVYEKVRHFIQSLIVKETRKIKVIDMDEEIPDFFLVTPN